MRVKQCFAFEVDCDLRIDWELQVRECERLQDHPSKRFRRPGSLVE